MAQVCFSYGLLRATREFRSLLDDYGLLGAVRRGVVTQGHLCAKVDEVRAAIRSRARAFEEGDDPEALPAKRRRASSGPSTPSALSSEGGPSGASGESLNTGAVTDPNKRGKRVRHKRWTEEEEDALIEEHRKFGGYRRGMWQVIGKRFPGRTVESVRDHWHQARKYKPDSRLVRYQKALSEGSGGEWTEDEERTLIMAHRKCSAGVGAGGEGMWREVAMWLPGRSARQVLDHWRKGDAELSKGSPMRVYRAEIAGNSQSNSDTTTAV